LCIQGDKEIENVHYWETYAPVVSWTTVQLLLILAAELELATRQVDYTAAFIHADVDTPPGFDEMSPEDQYRSLQFAEMPRGFAEPGKVLRLKKNLYGKKAAPRLWFQHLRECLVATGFQQRIDVDPCLFISDKVICLVYVDDTLLY
jgi:Reverse transcriptase (RNA-dependent DNA polymerase)